MSSPPISIRHLYISHSAPYLPRPPPPFLLGIAAVSKEIENNAYAKFWRQIRRIMGDVQVAYFASTFSMQIFKSQRRN